MRNLFDFAVSLLACFTNDSDPVDSHLLVVPFTLSHKYDQTVHILELDEPQFDLCSVGLWIPILLFQCDILCSLHTITVVEAEDLGLVCENFKDFGS